MNSVQGHLEVVRVESKRDLLEFVRFPWHVYRGEQHWVPPIIKEQMQFLSRANPFFEHAWAEYYLARRGRKTCGRISVSVDQNYIDFHNEKMGCFGFLEALDDYEVASRLLDVASDRLKEEEIDVMRGPFNFTTNHECGLLVDGFDSDPVMLTTYNPPYYAGFLERYGLRKARDLYSYHITDLDVDTTYLRELAKKAEQNHVVARPVNLGDMRSEMRRVKEIYNNAWSKNWGFVPLTEAEIEDMAHHFKALVIDDLTFIGELDGKPIGFLMFLPDYNVFAKKVNGKMGPIQMIQFLWYKNRIKKGRLFMMGVHRDFRETGVAAAMVYNVHRNIIKHGFTSAEFSWILEDNMPVRAICEMIGGKIYKTHRIYELPLTSD